MRVSQAACRLVVRLGLAAALAGASAAAIAQGSGFGNTAPRAPAPAPASPPRPSLGFGNTAPAAPPAAPAPPPVAVAPPPAAIAPPPAASASPPPAVAAPVAPTPATPAVAAAPAIVPPPLGAFAIEPSAIGFTARNIVVRIGSLTYQAPRAEIAGKTLSRDDLARLLDPASDAPAAERVGRLAASSITIPELYSIVETPSARQATLYRDLRLSDLAGGKLRSAVSSGGTLDGTGGKDGGAHGTYGRLELAGLDLSLAVALATEPAAAGGPGAMQPIYSSFVMEGLNLTNDQRGGTATIARIAGRDVSGRRTPDGWAGTIRRIAAAPPPEKATKAERTAGFAAILDILGAYEIGEMELSGIAFTAPKAEDFVLRIARVGYRGGAARSAEIALDGLEAGSGANKVVLNAISLSGIAIGPALEAARDLVGREPDAISPADYRRLVPTIGSIRVTGVDIRTDAAGQPQRVGLGAFELGADKPIAGLPSDIRLSIRDIAVPVDPAGTDEGMRGLRELGYARVEASLAASLAYDEAGSQIVLRELSARGAGMGSVMARAVLGNVSRDLFAPDTALASVAAVAATIRSVDLGIEDAGLFERVVAREAKRHGKTPADIRRDYGVAAAIGIPVLMGNSADAKALGQAVARFVAKPGRLLVKLRTRDPAGLGFTDFAAAANPMELLDRVEIQAAAE